MSIWEQLPPENNTFAEVYFHNASGFYYKLKKQLFYNEGTVLYIL